MMGGGQGGFFNRLLMKFPFVSKQLMPEGFGLVADF